MKLNTTREEREKYLSKTDSWSSYSDALARDANTLEDELARVRDALADARSELNKTEDERDTLRESLESAEMVIDLAEDTIPAGLNTHGVCLGLPVAVRQYRERFGGRR